MLLRAPWSRQKSNHNRDQASKNYSQLRVIERMHSSITPIKIHLNRQKKYLFSSLRLIMYSQIPTKEHFMTIIGKRFCLTKKTCPNKILKFIPLDSISGITLLSPASKVMKMIMVASTKFTEKFLKNLKAKRLKLLQ